MHNFMTGFRNGDEVSIDPSDIRVNAALTNMTVATYPEKELDRGNRKPIFENFRDLNLGEDNKKKLETVFKKEIARLKKNKKVIEAANRAQKKNKKIVLAG